MVVLSAVAWALRQQYHFKWRRMVNLRQKLHGVCPPPSLSCSLNDACCSGGALMWEIAVMFSMWQIIRHANQVEAAVESLITVRVPPQRQLCALCRLPLSPSRPPPSLPCLPRCTSTTPHSPAALVAPDRQMDQRLEHWDVSRVCGELGTVAAHCVLRETVNLLIKIAESLCRCDKPRCSVYAFKAHKYWLHARCVCVCVFLMKSKALPRCWSCWCQLEVRLAPQQQRCLYFSRNILMPPAQFDLKEIITPILSLLLNPNQEPVFLLWFRVKNNKCICKKYIFHYKQLMCSERRLTAQKGFFFFFFFPRCSLRRRLWNRSSLISRIVLLIAKILAAGRFNANGPQWIPPLWNTGS